MDNRYIQLPRAVNPSMPPTHTCELCATTGGEVLFDSALYRIVRVDDPAYPGFCRVILNRHEREMTDLPADEQHAILHAVLATETVVRKLFSPDKINLASLGNVVPHVHWHIIPRWINDRCFPNPIWGSVQREANLSPRHISSETMARELAILLA